MATTSEMARFTVKQVPAVLLTVVLSMTGFWMMHGRNLVTRDEVSKMIQVESPYIADRSLISELLHETKSNNAELKGAIDLNTQAIIKLQATMEIIASHHNGGRP